MTDYGTEMIVSALDKRRDDLGYDDSTGMAQEQWRSFNSARFVHCCNQFIVLLGKVVTRSPTWPHQCLFTKPPLSTILVESETIMLVF